MRYERMSVDPVQMVGAPMTLHTPNHIQGLHRMLHLDRVPSLAATMRGRDTDWVLGAQRDLI